MTKINLLQVPIFNRDVYYQIGGDSADFQEKLERKLGHKFDNPFPNGLGFCSKKFSFPCRERGFFVLWVREGESPVHELFHLTAKILKDVSIPLSKDSEEVYAYLIKYLEGEIK